LVGSERLIKLDDSWFSAKSILVERKKNKISDKALNRLGGYCTLPNLIKLGMGILNIL